MVLRNWAVEYNVAMFLEISLVRWRERASTTNSSTNLICQVFNSTSDGEHSC